MELLAMRASLATLAYLDDLSEISVRKVAFHNRFAIDFF